MSITSRLSCVLRLLAVTVLVFSNSGYGVSLAHGTAANESRTIQSTAAFAPATVLVQFNPGVSAWSGSSSTATSHLSLNSSRLQADFADLAVTRAEPVFAETLAAGPNIARDNLSRIYRLHLSSGSDVNTAIATLRRNPDVVYAEPDYIARSATAPPNDPLYGSQWGLTAIHAEGAWSIVTGAVTITLAIVDSGLDTLHPDFANRLWLNPGEIAGNSLDDDSNGYVDDVHGWDFVGGAGDVSDANGHGTEVSGVAGATTDDAQGIAGMCWTCRLMPVIAMQPAGIANYSDVAAGIAYAAAKGAQVINLSLGGYADSATLRAAIQAASTSAVIVAGAGNDDTNVPFYPAAYPTVLAVAGTTITNTKAAFSNYGSWVDVAAPAVSITTTFAGGGWGPTSGTSLAAPFVSGLAGLVWTQHPDWTPAMVRSHIIQTASSLATSDAIYGSQLGAGLIDATRATQAPLPRLVIDSYAVNGMTAGRPSPNTTGNALVLKLRNDWADAANITATLSTADPAVFVDTAVATFGTISNTAATNGSAFTFDVNPAAGYNHPVQFTLDLSANNGAYTTTLPFTLTTRGAETPVSLPITVDTVWASDQVYVISGDVSVSAGITLTIPPGTLVKFKPGAALTINGTLIAAATPESPIQFKGETSTTTWNRILFADSSPDAVADAAGAYASGSLIRHAQVEGATGGIACAAATPYLANIVSESSGINCAPGATPLWALDNTLSGGLYVTGGVLNAQRNRLSGKGLVATSLANVLSNTVTGAGISIGTGLLAENIIRGGNLGLGSNSIARDNTIIGGGISAGNTVTITRNSLNGGGISVGSNSKVLSNTVQFAPNAGLSAGINVTAQANRLVHNGQGLVASNGGQISQNLIADNAGVGMQLGCSALYATSVISNSVTGNGGHALRVYGTSTVATTINGNNFEGNLGLYDLYVDLPWGTGTYVPAQRNWWGTTDPAAIAARIFDFNDDGTKAKVTFAYNLSGPAQDAPAYVRTVNVTPDTVLGIQTGTFSTLFSRPMDTSFYPALSFHTTKRGAWHPYNSANSGLPANTVNAIAIDVFGTPWFGTPANGVAHFINNLWQTYTTVNSDLPNNTINATAGDADGSVWFGTAAGVAQWQAAGTWVTHTTSNSGLPGNHILAMAIDANRAKWFGTPNGAAWFDGATWITYTVDNSGLPANGVTAIAPDLDDTTWFGTSNGAAHFDGLGWTTYTTATSALPGNAIHAIAVDGAGVKWFGTDAGLSRYDGGTWTVYTTTVLPALDVRAITVDANDVKWIATSGGLARYDGVQWAAYTTGNSGLPDNDVRAIAADPLGVKWLGLGTSGVGMLSDSPDYAIGLNAHWVAPNQYQAGYEFSAVIPRGTYSLTVGNALGTDGLLSEPNLAYTLTVDYANLVADPTPPSAPSVATFSQGALNAISMNWTASDPDSSVTQYRYAIGTSPSGRQVVSWTPITGTGTTRLGLTLIAGQTYFVTMQARNAGGVWSQTGVSNRLVAGRVTDGTPPSTPIVTATNSGTFTTLRFSWTPSHDLESGLVQYRYAIGTTSGGQELIAWTAVPSTTTSITRTDLALSIGQTYYVTVQAQNGAGTWSANGTSNGVTVFYQLYLPLIRR